MCRLPWRPRDGLMVRSHRACPAGRAGGRAFLLNPFALPQSKRQRQQQKQQDGVQHGRDGEPAQWSRDLHHHPGHPVPARAGKSLVTGQMWRMNFTPVGTSTGGLTLNWVENFCCHGLQIDGGGIGSICCASTSRYIGTFASRSSPRSLEFWTLSWRPTAEILQPQIRSWNFWIPTPTCGVLESKTPRTWSFRVRQQYLEL